jgi:hypothetical protein
MIKDLAQTIVNEILMDLESRDAYEDIIQDDQDLNYEISDVMIGIVTENMIEYLINKKKTIKRKYVNPTTIDARCSWCKNKDTVNCFQYDTETRSSVNGYLLHCDNWKRPE